MLFHSIVRKYSYKLLKLSESGHKHVKSTNPNNSHQIWSNSLLHAYHNIETKISDQSKQSNNVKTII